jgi:chromosome segregation ATPase
MANRKVTITIDTKANISGATQATQAMDKLAASSTKVSATGQAAGKNVSRFGQIAGQAGFQIQDFAVQTMAGTSALTAFAQQAPQLLGAFGPAGAIAGAVVAVGAIAAKVFMGMQESAEEASKGAEKAFEDMLEVFQKAGGKDAEKFISQLKLMSEIGEALSTSSLKLIEVQNQRIKSDNDVAKSLSKQTEEALKYLEATGQIKSAEEAIIQVRKQQDELDKKAAIAQADAMVQSASNRYKQILQQKTDLEAEIATAEARINELQAGPQTAAIQKVGMFQKIDQEMIDRGSRDEGYASQNTKEAQAELARIEEQIKGLYEFVDASPQKIGALTVGAVEAAAEVDIALADAKIKIESIEQQSQIKEKTEAITQTVSDLKEGVKEITDTVSKFEPVNETQKQAKEKIMAAVADGELTAKEQNEISSSLQLLMGTLKTGQESQIKSLQDLIKLNSELTAKVIATDSTIQKLRSQIGGTLPAR